MFIDLKKNLIDVWVCDVELGVMGAGGCRFSATLNYLVFLNLGLCE